MPWVRVDDHFDEHPKMARVGPLGWAMWLAGLAYCNRNLTDGFIPWNVAKRLVAWEFLSTRETTGKTHAWTVEASTGQHTQEVDGEFVICLLLENGLWTEVEDGYVIHDFSEYQPTKTEVLTERKKWADRQAKSRDKSRRDSPSESPHESRGGHTRPVPVPVAPSGSYEPSGAKRARNGSDDVWTAALLIEELTGRTPSPKVTEDLRADVAQLGAERVMSAIRDVHGSGDGPFDSATLFYAAHNLLFPLTGSRRESPKERKQREIDDLVARAKAGQAAQA